MSMKSIHISAEFSQKIDKSCGECRESEEFSSRCNCTRCTLSRRSSRVKSASTSASPRGFSISSPAISLPKIKSQPRTCSRSCGRISNAKKQVERSLSCRTNSCCKRLKRREDSSGDDEAMNRRQVDQRYEINRCFGFFDSVECLPRFFWLSFFLSRPVTFLTDISLNS